MTFKTLLKTALGVVLTASLAFSANAAFAKKNTYEGQFSDVAETSWYKNDVAAAYELGFVKGTSDTLYSPNSSVSVAEAITMASRVHAEYNGKTITETSGGKWYDAYVNYAKNNGIITNNQFDSFTREIKRYEMAEIFHDAMGSEYFTKINDVVFIPDVPIGSFYWDKLITLYNAGVVMGNDEYGSFNPDSNIKRSECAAIIGRVAIPQNRQKKELSDFTSGDAYVLCYNVSMGGSKEGINSGWVFDNRGGPAQAENSGASAIGDVSTKYGSCYIREFNFIPSGRLVLETEVSATDDGAYLEYLDIEGNIVYQLKIVDGNWSILTDKGYVSTGVSGGSMRIRVAIDLDKGVSETWLSASKVEGTFPLLSDNILSYRVGMDEKGVGTVSVAKVNMVMNYAVYENFDIFGIEEDHNWNVANTSSKRSNNELFVYKNSAVTKNFDAISGKICFETYFNSVTGDDFIMSLGNILDIESKSGKLTSDGKELYNLTKNMWYRLRVEADTNTGKADILLNGRSIGEVNLGSNEAVSNITFDGRVTLDNIHVFNLYDHADYVPEPTTKANLDDYIVGLNICSLWRNGTHYGWACISAYDEPVPVIGMYDEGNPESADWEIKYMVEHGIDFQAFCWYAENNSAPLKYPSNGEQLHHGYMYAKYSDYMKYCILWEAANASHFTSGFFRNYVIPYWFENYFLDPRYMTIDNKLVLPIFSATSLIKDDYFGSVEGVKAEFDYLEKVAKSYGFDGVLFFACGSSSDSLAAMGFDGAYAYNWGTAGKTLDHNKTSILNSAKNQNMYTIPTISVGFDSVPWLHFRYGNMTTEDYAKAHEWVKNEYLPKYSPKFDFADNFTWLSTWNEYGEGTYIMPSGLNGFGYVDVIRDAYTDLPHEHEDVVPTLKQKERITHLYPQYAKLLRRSGWYYYDKTDADAESEPKNKLYINDVDIQANAGAEFIIPPVVKNGKAYFAFNPSTAVNYILGSHYEYRKDAGTLKIMANGHEVFFKVGYDRYYLDGTEKDLGYTVELFDGLVMLDFEKLGKDLGYKTETKNGDVYIYTDTFETLWKTISERKTGVWEFNNDYDNEGFSSSHMTLVTRNGSMKMTTVIDTNDPTSFYAKTAFPEDFYTKKFTALEIKCRYKYSGGNNMIAFYYTTDVDSKYDESKNLRLPFPSSDSNGEWVTLRKDLSNESPWQMSERLTGLRFDPFNAQGEIEIDYIRFIEDPDYVYVSPEDRPFEIKNGDAEGTLNFFYSGNADITRVEDPDNKENHVWKVKSHDIANNYTYFRTLARFKPNTAYSVEYDIKLIGNTKNSDKALQTSFNTNFRYADKGAFNDFDHVVQNSTNQRISVSDGWVHVKAIYETGKIDNHEKSEFTIYMNPQGEYSFSFMLDNIVVKEIEDYKPEIPVTQTFSWNSTKGKMLLEFNDGADDFSVGAAKEQKLENGLLYLLVEAPAYDITITPNEASFDAKKYNAVAIRFKAESIEASNPFFQVFFATDTDENLSEGKSAKCAYSSLTTDKDGYMTAVLDFSKMPEWKGKITTLRFDPANSAGEFYIDKIMLIEA